MALLSIDTCFLIDHQREVARRQPGPAMQFLHAHPNDRFSACATAWGEYLAGFDDPAHPFVAAVRRQLEIIPVDEAASRTYARLFRSLKQQGALIGANDLWIAAAAVARKIPLVSRHGSEFGRVPGLMVLVY